MSSARGRAHQRDTNEPDIIAAFKRLGWLVIQHTAYDLDVVCPRGRQHILAVEVKTKRGTLTKSQKALIADGVPLHIVRSVADVLALVRLHMETEHA